MARIEPVWNAVIAAEDARGEESESFARTEAEKAARSGDSEAAANWIDAANELHTLHSINRVRTPRGNANGIQRRP